ncbi:hypothetical protein V6Z12_A13G084600 [Gossypium hirsutum]
MKEKPLFKANSTAKTSSTKEDPKKEPPTTSSGRIRRRRSDLRRRSLRFGSWECQTRGRPVIGAPSGGGTREKAGG